MLNKVSIQGIIRITVRDLDGNITEQTELRNAITILLFNKYRDALAGDFVNINDLKIWGMGVGDDDTPPTENDTSLVNETFRKALTTYSKPADGQYKTIVYLAPADAVGQIKELGWFAGPSASITPDSGMMIARVLYDKNKTTLESIQIERLDSIEEA